MDIERKGVTATDDLDSTIASHSSDELANQLALVSERLAAEVETSTVPSTPRAGTPERSVVRSAEIGYKPGEHSCGATSDFPTSSATAVGTPHGRAPRGKTGYGVERLRKEFDAYSVVQHDLLQEVLVSGRLQGATDGQLRLHRPRPSLRDVFGLDFVDGNAEGDIFPAKGTVRRRSGPDQKDVSVDAESGDTQSTEAIEAQESQEKILMDGHSLIRVWGFLFALEQVSHNMTGRATLTSFFTGNSYQSLKHCQPASGRKASCPRRGSMFISSKRSIGRTERLAQMTRKRICRWLKPLLFSRKSLTHQSNPIFGSDSTRSSILYNIPPRFLLRKLLPLQQCSERSYIPMRHAPGLST